MKKVLILYLICIVSLFFLPVLLVKENFTQKPEKIKSNLKIKLLISETGEVKSLNLEEYIMGVLIGEMPISFELEALKAQAVVARTYTLNKILNTTRFSYECRYV